MPKSNGVLFENERVMLAKYSTKGEPKYADTPASAGGAAVSPVSAIEPPFNKALFDKLRELRRAMAEELGVAPFVVFHDATLRQMAMYIPQNEPQMLNISGVGVRKMAAYGQPFLKAILDFLAQEPTATPDSDAEKTKPPRPVAPPKGPTNAEYRAMLGLKLAQLRDKIAAHYNTTPQQIYSDNDIDYMCDKMPLGVDVITTLLKNTAGNVEAIAKAIDRTIIQFLTNEGLQMKAATAAITYAFTRQGLSIEEITQKRFLSANTINGHLLDFYLQGYPIEHEKFISQAELNEILPILRQKEAYPNPKAVFEALNEKYDYAKIKWAGAYLTKNADK